MTDQLKINPELEAKKIVNFIKTVLKEQGFKNVVLGLSGGIDSAASLGLLSQSIAYKNIFVAHLYYFESEINGLKSFLNKLKIPTKNIYNISIKKSVDKIKQAVGLKNSSPEHKLRLGNIMARVRMIILYDLAKKHKALVCGTENKSEYLLGYFTRFGDEASDFEPIRHLYKTQVYQLAKYLKIPQKIINTPPTAGLFVGQTDEKDFGFTYKEADQVLQTYFDKKEDVVKINLRHPNAVKIIKRSKNNLFKRHLPYKI
jgi:NAD+ synthase